MFKFDFDLEDAEEVDILNLETLATNAENKKPVDEALALEPFSEVLITPLVRAILSPAKKQALTGEIAGLNTTANFLFTIIGPSHIDEHSHDPCSQRSV